MKPFHSLFPELAQKEVRCIVVGPGEEPDPEPEPTLPPGKYVFCEYYCDDLECDCRQAFFRVYDEAKPTKTLASLSVGWEDEAFYRKLFDGDRESAAAVVRGIADPINNQSKYTEDIMDLFQRFVKTTPYLLRLRRHYKLFREEVQRREIP